MCIVLLSLKPSTYTTLLIFYLIAQQEAERARFLVEKVSRSTYQRTNDCAPEDVRTSRDRVIIYFKGTSDTCGINLREKRDIFAFTGNFDKKYREQLELFNREQGQKAPRTFHSLKVSQVPSVVILLDS